MPWHVGRKTPKGWPIVKSDTGEIVGFSTSKSKAEASVRARYANYKGGGTKKRTRTRKSKRK